MLIVAWYLVIITMVDGSQGRHHGCYSDACAAIDRAMGLFPQAHRISARRVA